MRKTLLLIGLFVLALVLVACGNEPEDDGDDAGSDEAQPEETEDVDEGDGEEIYQESCATCHGDDLEGANGPELEDNDLSKDEILEMIEEGGDGMPADVVEGEDAESVAEWLEDQ